MTRRLPSLALLLALTLGPMASQTAPTARHPRRAAVHCAGAPNDRLHYRWYWEATVGMYTVLRHRYRFGPEEIFFLFPDRHGGDPRVDDRAARAALRRVFRELARRLGPEDHFFGFFVGHGGRQGPSSFYELLDGRLSDRELDRWRRPLRVRAQTYVFTPCNSGGFARVLGARPGTVVLTSTRIDEKNAAGFAEAVRDALDHAPGADRDRDGRVSFGEAYLFALRAVRTWYARRGRPLAEHPLLADQGDGTATHGPGPRGGKGRLAWGRFLPGPPPPPPEALRPRARTRRR